MAMAIAMASSTTIFTLPSSPPDPHLPPSPPSLYPYRPLRPPLASLSPPQLAHHRTTPPPLPLPLPSSFFSWDARSHLGSPSYSSLALAQGWLKQSKLNTRGVVQASLFGVGAPEALVIAVVALLVFGPKGLAEVARTLGKSLRAFQPTLREIQQVSREFKNTLEQEIGLDELRSYESRPPQSSVKSEQQPLSDSKQNGLAETKAYSTEDYMRVTEEQAKALVPEEQRKAAETAAWGGTTPKATVEVADEQTKSSDGAVNNIGQS